MKYQERKKSRTYVNVNKDGKSIGIYGSLRTACEAIQAQHPDFYSYWTIIKNKERPLVIERCGHVFELAEHPLNEVQGKQLT